MPRFTLHQASGAPLTPIRNRRRIYDPGTHQYQDRECLPVPENSGAGTYLYPGTHLMKGQRFALHAYRDIRNCTGEMWAGQGWTVGGADSSNYTHATFTAGNPGLS